MDAFIKRGVAPPSEETIEITVTRDELNRERMSKTLEDCPAVEEIYVIPSSGSNAAEKLDEYTVRKRKRSGTGEKKECFFVSPLPDCQQRVGIITNCRSSDA